MSRKTSIPRKIILGDRGIQTYRSCDKGFAGSMRLTTFKEANDAIVIRESEYAKPYGEQYEDPHEDYSAMEYQVPNMPPWGWDGPGVIETYTPWHIVFYCGVDACWCEDQTLSFDAKCGWEIINVEFDPPWNDVTLTFNKSTIFINAAVGTTGCGTMTITMRAPVPKGGGLWQGKYSYVIGQHSDIQVCMCLPSECDVCDDSAIAWDSTNSPETIARSASATVYITDSLGTGGPYTWSVSGTGFSLTESETVGLTNTLNTDGAACGSAVITVTGCDGTEITGYVRCTAGSTWSSPANLCTTPDGWVLQVYCTLIHKQYRDIVYCGCIDPNSCPAHTPHPCGALTGCTPSNPIWNTWCAYVNCDDYWCAFGETMTRNWIFRETWICS